MIAKRINGTWEQAGSEPEVDRVASGCAQLEIIFVLANNLQIQCDIHSCS